MNDKTIRIVNIVEGQDVEEKALLLMQIFSSGTGGIFVDWSGTRHT
jgi:hypothetical protein